MQFTRGLLNYIAMTIPLKCSVYACQCDMFYIEAGRPKEELQSHVTANTSLETFSGRNN